MCSFRRWFLAKIGIIHRLGIVVPVEILKGFLVHLLGSYIATMAATPEDHVCLGVGISGQIERQLLHLLGRVDTHQTRRLIEGFTSKARTHPVELRMKIARGNPGNAHNGLTIAGTL